MSKDQSILKKTPTMLTRAFLLLVLALITVGDGAIANTSGTLPQNTQAGKNPKLTLVRPTPLQRGADAQGCGGFSCRRAHGLHRANDYLCTPGDPIIASASGRVSKIGWSKRGSPDLRYVRVKVNDRLSFETHYLTNLEIDVGETVQIGSIVGYCASLKSSYPSAFGMQNHVHQYVTLDDHRIDAEANPKVDMLHTISDYRSENYE